MMKNALLLLVALAMAVAGCADDSPTTAEGDADEAAAETGTEDAPTTSEAPVDTEPPATDGAEAEAANDETAAEATGDAGSLGARFAELGVEPSPEAIDCLQSRGYSLADSAIGADQNEAVLAVMVCAGDELAPLLLAEDALEGVDPEKAECMVTEVFNHLGTLPTEEALAMFEATDTAALRDAAAPALAENCGATPAEIDAIFEPS